MPRKHIPNDSPLSLTGRSCISDMKCTAGFGLSGPATLLIGIAIDTVRPLQAFDAGGRARALSTIVEAMAKAKEAGLTPGEFSAGMRLVDWQE
jgi:hypothetical protein